MRFEIPAVFVVDADDSKGAVVKAGELTRTLTEESGPGAFFCGVGVVATDLPKQCEEDREEESVDQHVRSIIAGAPLGF